MTAFSLSNYLRILFGSGKGYFRVIVFVVTSASFSTNGSPKSKDQIVGWIDEGLNRLPEPLAQIPFGPDSSCTALVYEFETGGGSDAPQQRQPGLLSGPVHLQRSGIAANLHP